MIERLANEAYRFGQQIEERKCWLVDKQMVMKDFLQKEKRVKDKTLQVVQVALQQREADCTVLRDELCLLSICVQ